MFTLVAGSLIRSTGHQISPLICKIKTDHTLWRAKDKRASVEIRLYGRKQSAVMPSLRLIGLPERSDLARDEYWAPLSLSKGTASKHWQAVEAHSPANPLTIYVAPTKLLWASTK